MKFKKAITTVNFFLIVITFLNIFFINYVSRDKIKDYSTMLASKITKYIVNNAYVREKVNYYTDDIYDVVKDDTNEIKNIVYDAGVVNELINSIT